MATESGTYLSKSQHKQHMMTRRCVHSSLSAIVTTIEHDSNQTVFITSISRTKSAKLFVALKTAQAP
jgi:ribosomal protein L2